MTVSNLRQNILIDVQGSQDSVKPGETCTRIITIRNRGQRKVNLTLYLQSKEEMLLQWYDLNVLTSSAQFQDKKREISILIEPGDTNEYRIELIFSVPQTTEPRIYNYEICTQDTQDMGEFIPPRPQQLRVEASRHYLESRHEPNFVVEPQNNSENPLSLKPGEKSEITVKVKNRSVRVDWFYLTFPELDAKWFVNDAETNLTPEIRLNPGQEATFNVSLRPPEHTPPGNYFSTIRLRSHISNTVLLDMIYFNILVDDRLQLSDMSPTLCKIPTTNKKNPCFEFHISNLGNIPRNLNFKAADEEGLFHYQTRTSKDKEQLKLLNPGETENIILVPQIKKRWFFRRPWKGEGQVIPFVIDIQDSVPVQLPDRLAGTIIWKPYSRLERWLLITIPIIIILGLLGLLVYKVQEIVWNAIVLPTLKPQITEVSTTEKSYQAESNNQIKLNWEIHNIAQLSQVKLTSLHNDIKSKTVIYDLNTASITEQLASNQDSLISFGKLQNQNNQLSKLTPKIIKLNDGTIKQEQDNFCQIEPVVTNKSFIHSVWKFIYAGNQEMKDYISYENKAIKCRKILAVPLPIQTEKPNNNTNFTNEAILNKSVKPQHGNYEFQVELMTDLDISAKKIIKDIKVTPAPEAPPEVPPPSPEILTFASKIPIYRKSDNSKAPTVNSQSQPQLPTAPIKVSWSIANPKTVFLIKISTVFIGLDGSVTEKPQILPFSLEKGIVKGLEKYCPIPEKTKPLTCDNVPINNTVKSGQYKFIITAFSRPEAKPKLKENGIKPSSKVNQEPLPEIKEIEISKTIESVQVKPSLPEITAFKAEDKTPVEEETKPEDKTSSKNEIQSPSYVVMVDPIKNKGAIDVNLTWNIKHSDPVTVELLPAPGVLPLNAPNQMVYRLSPNPGATPITLKVTNQVGESVTRTIVLQVAQILPPPVTGNAQKQSPTVPAPPLPDGATPSSTSPSNSISNPEEFLPFELPPRAN